MTTLARILGSAASAWLAAVPLAHATDNPRWSQPQQPFRIYGNTWYVGSLGLSAILVTSPQGHVLIDGTLPGNAGMIEANIRALGFKLRDIRVILNTHAHVDHAGAIAKLAKDSGAQVRASTASARQLEKGGVAADDPQYSAAARYPLVPDVQVVRDGGTVQVGTLRLTAHYTPGHTPGSTSWTWRSCERQRCLDIAYVDSLTALGRPGYRFSAHPRYVANFRHGLATAAALPCDILLTPHPEASGLADVVDAHGANDEALIDAGACRRYAAKGEAGLDAQLAKEHAAR